MIQRLIILLTIMPCLMADLMGAQGALREREILNRDWTFTFGDPEGAETPEFDDSGWQHINLPHSFSIPYFMGEEVYQGYGWYHKEIYIPAQRIGRNLNLQFEGIFLQAEVYVNGTCIGKHTGGYTGFDFDITPHIYVGKNLIAVRVNNIHRPDVAPRTGDHQFSGGIYRDVYLNITDPVHVKVNGSFVKTSGVTDKSATANILLDLENNSVKDATLTITTEILNPEGKRVASAKIPAQIASGKTGIVNHKFPKITSPELWSPEHPALYKAVTTISRNGKAIDRYETVFGIRDFRWTADSGFFLNGKKYFLRGANVHQDQAGWGDAVTNASARRDVRMIKEAGFNCIRGSHYPHDPAFAQACDELGIILFMENAFWGMGGSSGDRTDFGTPPPSCYPVNPSFHDNFDRSVLSQLKEMITIHRNSPSIAAWSLCNEAFFTDNSTDMRMKNLLNQCTDSARMWDPTRHVAIGGCQRKGLDTLGKGAIAFYNGDGADFDWRGVPVLVSEYGSYDVERPGRFESGFRNLEEKSFEGDGDPWNPPVWRSGHVIWCGFDHGTIGGRRLGTMGIIDYFRIPKREYYWYKAAYTNNDPHPDEPEWASVGIPARLSLSADKNILASADGTDDALVLVTVLDSDGRHISNSVPVTLEIISGPGEFPTGRSIRFMPKSDSEESDIRIADGLAAITFRSYHGGTSVIKASSPGLKDAFLTLTTEGQPMWREGKDIPVADRPYHRYSSGKQGKDASGQLLLAANRPSWVSSWEEGSENLNANDGDNATCWRPAKDDNEAWWRSDLEAAYDIDCILVELPENTHAHYIIEVTSDGREWHTVAECDRKTKKQRHQCVEYAVCGVRVSFLSDSAQRGLAEVSIGGTASRL